MSNAKQTSAWDKAGELIMANPLNFTNHTITRLILAEALNEFYIACREEEANTNPDLSNSLFEMMGNITKADAKNRLGIDLSI